MMVIVLKVDVELRSLDACFLTASDVQMELIQMQLLQFILQLTQLHSKIEHGANKHVATDSTKYIQVKRLHCNSPAASALIWLAAKPAPNPLLMLTTVN